MGDLAVVGLLDGDLLDVGLVGENLLVGVEGRLPR